MVDFSAIASSGDPMLCTSDRACLNCFHGTTVLANNTHTHAHAHTHTTNVRLQSFRSPMAESCHFFFYFSSDPSTVRKKYRTFCRASEKIQDIRQDFRSLFRYTCQALLYLGSILKVAMLVVSNSRPIPVYPKAHFALLCTSATYF